MRVRGSRPSGAEQAEGTDVEAREAAVNAADAALEAASIEVRDAVEKAQDALIALVDAAAGYDALVAEHGGALAAVGLPLADGDPETAGRGAAGGQLGAVRVRGRWHLPVDAGTVLARVVWRVASARLPRGHRVAAVLGVVGGRRWLSAPVDDLVDFLPPPPEVQRAALPRPDRPDFRQLNLTDHRSPREREEARRRAEPTFITVDLSKPPLIAPGRW